MMIDVQTVMAVLVPSIIALAWIMNLQSQINLLRSDMGHIGKSLDEIKSRVEILPDLAELLKALAIAKGRP
jgi:hypothetical protein